MIGRTRPASGPASSPPASFTSARSVPRSSSSHRTIRSDPATPTSSTSSYSTWRSARDCGWAGCARSSGNVERDKRLIRVERAYSRAKLKRPKTKAGVRAVPMLRP